MGAPGLLPGVPVSFKREKSGQRHINVGELKAMLRAEEIHAKTRPESREIYGLDSQVCLAVL